MPSGKDAKRGRSVVCVFVCVPFVTMRLKRPDGLSIIASHRMKPEMSSYDPAELLRLCDSIIEDGELTYEELYELAEWLNSHREACAQWPGNVLVEPLQNAWADGKITKTESRQLSRLLLQVRKEAAKREADQLTGQAIQIASRTAETFDLTRPQLPAIPFSTRIKSYTTRAVFYEVDLSEPTCTCPDFRSFRSRLPRGHLTRCCKHIFGAYAQLEPSAGWPGWLHSFLGLAWAPHPKQKWHVMTIGQGWLGLRTTFVLISSAPKDWADAFAPENGLYDRYGYNVTKDRWAYEIEPPNSEKIRKAILTFSRK